MNYVALGQVAQSNAKGVWCWKSRIFEAAVELEMRTGSTLSSWV
jgi:hypothetical protein